MKFEYCPKCGMQTVAQNPTMQQCSSCKQQYWFNPKPSASIVFIRDGKLLYAKRGIEPNIGKYDFPGGFIDEKEDMYDACVREILEETGLKIDKSKLLLINGYTVKYQTDIYALDLIFIITEWSGEPKAKDDVAALEWKDIDFIQNLDFHPDYPGLGNKIKDYINK